MAVNASRFGSVAIRVMFGILTPPMAVVSLWGARDTFRQGMILVVVFLFFLLPIWLLLMDLALRDGPLVRLTEEGVWVRVWLRKRFYPWAQILQAGILYRSNYRGDRNWLFLLLPGGSAMGEKDRTFVYRNYGRIIWIHKSAEVLDYLSDHYGQLDFDKSK